MCERGRHLFHCFLILPFLGRGRNGCPGVSRHGVEDESEQERVLPKTAGTTEAKEPDGY